MEIFKVGGAVRDKLLGIAFVDNDYVVVGATIKEMLKLGYKQIGKDFPIFLHPVTKEEYALARLEKKVAKGYTGFTFITDPSVSLEDDLKRRDITINAIAEDIHGNVIDPYNGKIDLQNGIIRHVSEAFIEDPLRVLRVARFSAKFKFVIASETLQLMQQIVQNDELKTISLERIWLEVTKGIQTKYPFIFLKVLHQVGALKYLNEELVLIFSDEQLVNQLDKTLALAVEKHLNSDEIFSIVYFYLSLAIIPLTINKVISRTGLSNKTKKLCLLTIRVYNKLANPLIPSAEDIYELTNQLYRLRETDLFNSLLNILNLISETINPSDLISNLQLLENILDQLSQIDYMTEDLIKAKEVGINVLLYQIKTKKMQIILENLDKHKTRILKGKINDNN